MDFTYYGHSCFSVSLNGKTVLFDPFVTGNELANNIVDVDTIPADYILVSHGHGDHIASSGGCHVRIGAAPDVRHRTRVLRTLSRASTSQSR